jgi:phage terminase large subunit-like protein
VVVAVDPPATSNGDACGIVVVGLGLDGLGYVIEDATVAKARPEGWAAAVAAAAARHGADRVIAEANNGGEMVSSVLACGGGGAAGADRPRQPGAKWREQSRSRRSMSAGGFGMSARFPIWRISFAA